MASVTLSKVKKVYNNSIPVVHGIDLDIKDGEIMVLVGPSGCGKSTTLRMIAGLEKITEGSLKIGENVVNNIAPKDRNVAMVFQNYALYPHMTVYQNIAFGLKHSKVSADEIQKRVTEVAESLQIVHLLQRRPKDMSGGQRQRVALGRAIARQASVYLFDEPLSNLDAQLRVSMRVRLAQLHRELAEKGQSNTMIYVTHDQVEAMTLGHRICVMESGYIRQVDTPINLYKYPANKSVAAFIGSPSMNFIDISIEKRGDDYVALFCDTALKIPKDKSQKLSSYVGKYAVLGIRAEHIMLSEKPLPESFTLKSTIVERLGMEDYIYFPLENEMLVVRSSGQKDVPKANTTYYLQILPEELHIFDKDHEYSLTSPLLESSEKIESPLPSVADLADILGGYSNIMDLDTCATRLRFTLKDIRKVDQEKIARLGERAIFIDKNKIFIIAGKETRKYRLEFQNINN